jgi:hypothetical protein
LNKKSAQKQKRHFGTTVSRKPLSHPKEINQKLPKSEIKTLNTLAQISQGVLFLNYGITMTACMGKFKASLMWVQAAM